MVEQGSGSGPSSTASGEQSAKKGVTPPKGRPTRSRHGSGRRARAFGPVAQWITVGLLVALVVVVLVLVTDGGDFNPFNDDDPLPSGLGGVAPALDQGSGGTSHPM